MEWLRPQWTIRWLMLAVAASGLLDFVVLVGAALVNKGRPKEICDKYAIESVISVHLTVLVVLAIYSFSRYLNGERRQSFHWWHLITGLIQWILLAKGVAWLHLHCAPVLFCPLALSWLGIIGLTFRELEHWIVRGLPSGSTASRCP